MQIERTARAVAFDLDGLMFNTEELYTQVARVLLERRGRTLDDRVIQQMMGRPARVAFPIMIEWYGLTDSTEDLAAESNTLFDDLLPASLQPMHGLLNLLEKIDQLGLPKAIATSSGRAYLERILELAELPTSFDFTLTADDVSEGKPHPEIYLSAARRFGVAAETMIVLEDSENGCRAAVAASALAVAVPGRHNAGSQYDGAVLVADHLADPRIDQFWPRQ